MDQKEEMIIEPTVLSTTQPQPPNHSQTQPQRSQESYHWFDNLPTSDTTNFCQMSECNIKESVINKAERIVVQDRMTAAAVHGPSATVYVIKTDETPLLIRALRKRQKMEQKEKRLRVEAHNSNENSHKGSSNTNSKDKDALARKVAKLSKSMISPHPQPTSTGGVTSNQENIVSAPSSSTVKAYDRQETRKRALEYARRISSSSNTPASSASSPPTTSRTLGLISGDNNSTRHKSSSDISPICCASWSTAELKQFCDLANIQVKGNSKADMQRAAFNYLAAELGMYKDENAMK